MKYTFILFLLFILTSLHAQSNRTVKTEEIFLGKGKCIFYQENDKNGNALFTKNEGVNGPVSMIHVMEYDSLNREIKCYSVHSNLGYLISETVYEKGKILGYHHDIDEDAEVLQQHDRDFLHQFNSAKEFINSEAMQMISEAPTRVRWYDVLDSNNNVIANCYISEEGDTTIQALSEFNENNQEEAFHYETEGSETWTWDIYYKYDDRGNMIQSARVSSKNGVKDTSEVYRYMYNADSLLLSESYHYYRTFRNRTEYVYNSQRQLIKQTFYEEEEKIIDALLLFEYNEYGLLSKKTTYDYRKPKKEQKEIWIYRYTYW